MEPLSDMYKEAGEIIVNLDGYYRYDSYYHHSPKYPTRFKAVELLNCTKALYRRPHPDDSYHINWVYEAWVTMAATKLAQVNLDNLNINSEIEFLTNLIREQEDEKNKNSNESTLSDLKKIMLSY
ncbi:MAG: hypothetical protein H0T62_11630 [Parachlamydiaceae bacterium]|nr:hypothetical protein [Parachlamydiaceae bacterium]